jgi:hypothetical protein
VHALAHQINASLGNVGKTVFYTDPIEPNPAVQQQSIAQLMDDIIGKKVEMLFILGGNPAYTAPADAGFQQNLANVSLTVHLASHFNETSAFCQWHINEAHYLESWGDVRAEDGTISVIQPLIAPLYGGKSAYEVLAAIGPNPDQSSYEIVRAYWQQQNKGADFELFWRRTVHDGFMANTALPVKNVAPKNAGGSPASTQAASAQALQPRRGRSRSTSVPIRRSTTGGLATTPGCRRSPSRCRRSPGTTACGSVQNSPRSCTSR